MGKTTDDLERLAHEVSSAPAAREMDMLLTSGERISIALLCMAIIDRGEPAVSFTGSQAGILTDTTHTKAKILDVRTERLRAALDAGQHRRRRRLPGRLDGTRHHDARPRRLRHDRRRAGGRARRRRLRDLHRRVRGVHGGSARRARRTHARPRVLRRDARDGGDRRAGARAAIRRVRPQPRSAGPRPVELHVGTGHLGRRGGGGYGAGDHLGRHARRVRGEGHDRARPRPPGHRGEGVPAPRRRSRERRHDRAERLERGSHRHLVHRPARRPGACAQGHGRRDRRGRGGRSHPRHRDRSGLAHRRGNEEQPRCRRDHVRGPRDRGGQHRDDLDLDDPHLVRRAGSRRRAGRARRCTAPSSSTR